MCLAEYLYLDECRLDSYFEQISSTVAYDKVPVWNVALGLMGPSAEARQVRHARPFTTHEKIRVLCDYLARKCLVRNGRPQHEGDDYVFRLEKCVARRMHIPPKARIEGPFHGLALWVSNYAGHDDAAIRSARSRGASPLYLLESNRGDTFEVACQSSNSILKALLQDDRKEFVQTILGDRADEVEAAPEHAAFFSSPSELIKRLARWGVQVGDDRRIEVLYRVREVFRESFYKARAGVSTFAYPIFITELQREFW
jgi:hypothetical protein